MFVHADELNSHFKSHCIKTGKIPAASEETLSVISRETLSPRETLPVAPRETLSIVPRETQPTGPKAMVKSDNHNQAIVLFCMNTIYWE